MRINIRKFSGLTDWGWVTTRTQIKRVQDTCGMVAEDAESGQILAAVICDTWYDDSVHMHVCVDNPLVARHGFIEAVFDFVFNNEDRPNTKIIYGFVPENNKKALKLDKHIGFEHVYTLSGGTGGTGFHVLTMKKEDCKYLSEVTHGRT